MRILYLASKYKPQAYNGTIKFIENIAKNFSINNEVKLVSYCEETPDEYSINSNIKYWTEIIDSIECLKFSTEEKYKTNYSLYDEEIYKFALDVIKDFNPDIIHIGHPRRVASFMKAAIDLNKKYIITLTDSLMICPNTFLFTKSCEICNRRHQEGICEELCGFDGKLIENNHQIVKEYVNNAYALIAPSKFQARIYEEYFKKEVLVINHGNFVVNEYKEKKYPKGKLIFGFNGSSMALKGLNLLISVFNKIGKDYNVELHVYGRCDDTVKLLAGEKVKFYGTYDNNEISKILNSIDILICPSIWYENYPFVITEAFINRVPVIATNEGGMKELVKNFINGFTFELGDIHQLTEIIKYIYNNQNLITQLSNNLINYKCKTVEEEMKEYENLYYECNNNIPKNKKYDLLVENLWIDLIKNRYDNNDVDKYKQYIMDSLKNYNYYASIDMIYRFIVRMNNIERIFKNRKNNSIIIWGAGTSGRITMDILKNMYPNIDIKFFVDKHKYNEYIKGVQVKSINILEQETLEYIFICTNPGKEEAEKLMNKLNKKVNIDYNYGMCIE